MLNLYCVLYSLMKQPEGRVHFAGTEMASQWAGYMDGAILAGETAANAVSSAFLYRPPNGAL